MKVFISYSRKDAEFVNKLKEALEASDIGVIIDVESLEFGENLQAFLEQSVRETDLTIAVISKHSLQSVWVIAEALETLMYEHVERRKRFLPIYIDTSFLDDTLYLQIVEQIDKDIVTLQELTNQAIEKHLGTAHLDQKRERFIRLRNNLDNILKRLADVLVADFSSEEKFSENLPKLIEAIKQAEKERERYTGRPSAYLAPFQAPPLPQHFVPRPEVTDALKARLLNDESRSPGILVVSAIHGLGGIGKSTLAAALTYDEEVQKRFPDGILWATLGQQPEILSLISGWIHAMRDYDFRPTTIEAASAHLRTLLQDKVVLLVVDDVWNPEHAIHFKVGGPRCQVLITTREAIVAKAVDADLYSLDVMSPEQALSLLSSRLRRKLDGGEQEQATALAKEVGYLPLALELSAAQVADGVLWTELREELQAEIARLEVLEMPAIDEISDEVLLKRLSLRASFALSLRSLSIENLSRLAWLGILPEDVTISSAMTTTLWETDARHARDTLRYLYGKALLLPSVAFSDQTPTYRLHDLVHDVARSLVQTPTSPASPKDLPGVGLELPVAHATFLKRYEKHIQNGLWHTLPDDGYIHNYLTWHFQQAGKEEQIHVLLREETSEGRNGWYQVREQLGQTAGFLADVNLALKLAEEKSDIGLQCRYASLIASLNSLAKNIPAELMIACVEKGVWKPTQALVYACQIPDPVQRAKTLVRLTNNLPPPLKEKALREALAAAQVIADTRTRVRVLAKVAPHLPEALLRETLAATQGIVDVEARVQLLAELAPHLPEALLRETLAATQGITNVEVRAKVLAEVAPRLAKLGDPEEALAATQGIADVQTRAKALVEVALYLPVPMRETTLREALAAAQAIEDVWHRTRTLAGLATYLPRPLRENTWQEALVAAKEIGNPLERADALAGLTFPRLVELGNPEEMLAAAQAIGDAGRRARALVEVAPHLSESLLREALATAQAIEDVEAQAMALAGLALHLPKILEETTLREALAAAQAIEDARYRTEVLVMLVPHLREPFLQEALVATQGIADVQIRARALAEMALHLPEPMRGITLREALAAAQAIEDVWHRTRVLAWIIPHLPKPLRENMKREALRAAEEIENVFYRVGALAGLAPPHLFKLGAPEEMLAAVQAIGDAGRRARALVEVAPHLSESQLREALATVQVIEDAETQAETLARLATQLAELGLPKEALVAVQAIEGAWTRAKALVGMAPHLSESLLREALATAQAIGDVGAQAEALARLATRLAELGVPEEALRAAQTIGVAWTRIKTLARLATQLAELGVFEDALRTAQAIESTRDRAEALAGLATRLAELGYPEEALGAAQAIENTLARANALMEVASHLPEPLRENVLKETLVVTQAIEEVWARIRAPIEVNPRLTEPEGSEEALMAAQIIEDAEARAKAPTGLATWLAELGSLEEALMTAQAIEDAEARAEVLAGLFPYLPEPLRENVLREILTAAQAIEDAEARFWTLVRLTPYLPESLLQEVLVAAQTIEDAEDRVWMLTRLASRLAELPSTTLLSLWQELLENLVSHTREDLLANLGALTPVIGKLGGKEAIDELFHAIQDVGRWWP